MAVDIQMVKAVPHPDRVVILIEINKRVAEDGPSCRDTPGGR